MANIIKIAPKKKKNKKRLSKRAIATIVSVAAVVVVAGGVAGYVLYGNHKEEVAYSEAEDKIKSGGVDQPIYADPDMAIEYTARQSLRGNESARSVYVDAITKERADEGAHLAGERALLRDYYAIATEAGDGEGAIEAAKGLYDLNEGYEETYMLAKAYKLNGDTDRAVAYYEEVIDLDAVPDGVINAAQEEISSMTTGGN